MELDAEEKDALKYLMMSYKERRTLYQQQKTSMDNIGTYIMGSISSDFIVYTQCVQEPATLSRSLPSR